MRQSQDQDSSSSEGRGGRGLTRRQTLGAAGVAGAGMLLAGVGGGAAGLLGDGGEEAVAKQAKSCLRLTPEQEEGPFYVDLEQVRADIVEGQAGVPLDLRIRVIDHARCEPVKNAAVDIWQCNAAGVYSDEESEGTVGQTFLRGVQFTDATGWAELKTIYPGHYQGRATHIHVKVHIGGKRTKKAYSGGHICHTGQLLFHEGVTDAVYELAPYNQSTVARVPNAQDRVYSQQGGKYSMPKLSGDPSSGIAAKIVLGVDPSSTPEAVGATSGSGSGSGSGPGSAPPSGEPPSGAPPA
jgi:protocatechuate 3,4-dioxygenase beta subunit